MSENVSVVRRKKKHISYETKYISQIVKHTFFLENQLEIYNIIKNIPNHVHYFYIFENASLMMYNDLVVADKNAYNNIFQKNTYYVLKYRECKLYSFHEYLESILFSKKYIFFVLESYKKILQCVQLLIPLNIVHNHISKENLYMDEQKEFRLIQFQLSMHLTTSNTTSNYLQKYFKEYSPGYVYWPIEFHILSYLFTNNLESISKANIDKIINDVLNKNSMVQQIEIWYPNTISQFREEGIAYWYKYINKPISDIVKDMFTYYCTWDNMSTSVVFLELLKIQMNTNKHNVFLTKITTLLIQNIHFVPEKRLSVKQSLLELDDICYSTPKEIFVEMFTV